MKIQEIKHFLITYDKKDFGHLHIYPDNTNYHVILRPLNPDFFNSSKLIHYKNELDNEENEIITNSLSEFCEDNQDFEVAKFDYYLPNSAEYNDCFDRYRKALKDAGIL